MTALVHSLFLSDRRSVSKSDLLCRDLKNGSHGSHALLHYSESLQQLVPSLSPLSFQRASKLIWLASGRHSLCCACKTARSFYNCVLKMNYVKIPSCLLLICYLFAAKATLYPSETLFLFYSCFIIFIQGKKSGLYWTIAVVTCQTVTWGQFITLPLQCRDQICCCTWYDLHNCFNHKFCLSSKFKHSDPSCFQVYSSQACKGF